MLDLPSIWSLTQLPTLPKVARTLLELASSPETEQRQISQLIKADPAISAKLLNAANSTYFGVRSEAKGIDRAVSLLGSNVSSALALSFNLAPTSMTTDTSASTEFQNCWRHCLIQSAAAAEIAARTGYLEVDESSLCGLLLDIGRLAMLSKCEAEYCEILNEAQSKQLPLHEVELDTMAIHHGEVGARLMEQWGLPTSIVQSIRMHHASLGRLQELRNLQEFPFVSVAATAACAAELVDVSASPSQFEQLERMTKTLFRWSAEETRAFLEATTRRWREQSRLLTYDRSETSAEMMVMANEQLVRLTLRAHVACTQATLRHQLAEQERRNLEFQNKQLQQQALHDPLTKIYNRQFFDEMLETEAKRCVRCASPIGLIFVDVDNFKQINDTFGHQFGDVVLQQISRVFSSATRSSDVLARFGGEEFVILVNQPTELGMERLSERIRRNVEAEPFLFGGKQIPVTVSLGAAIAAPNREDRDLAHRLVAAADASLYDAKRAGRNQCRLRSLIDERERELAQQVLRHRFSRWLVAQHLLDIPSVSRALMECGSEITRLGTLAVQSGYLRGDQVSQLLEIQSKTGERFGEAAVRFGWLNHAQLVHLLSLQHENPKQLAAALIRLGIMSAESATEALDDYLLMCLPDSPEHPVGDVTEIDSVEIPVLSG